MASAKPLIELPRRDVYVARQPIFDHSSKIFGYELLYRSGFENQYAATDGDHASLSVLSDSAFVFGVEALAGNGRAFVNFTRTSLLNEYARVFPPSGWWWKSSKTSRSTRRSARPASVSSATAT